MDSIRFVAAARGEEETRSSRSSYAKPHSDRLVVTTRDFTMCVQRESFFLFFSNNFRLVPFFSYLIWVGIRPHLPNEKFSYFLKRNAAVELRHWRIFFVSLSLFLFVPVEKRKFWTMAQGGCKVRGGKSRERWTLHTGADEDESFVPFISYANPLRYYYQ